MTASSPPPAKPRCRPPIPPLPLAVLLLAFACLCWSSNYVLGRAVAGAVPPLGLAFWRWAVALMLLLPFTWRELWARRDFIRARLGLLVLLGVSGTSAYNALAYMALNYTTVIQATLANSSMPVVILLMSWLVNREPARVGQMAGVAVSTIGVAVIVTRGDVALVRTLALNPGDLLILAAVAAWSLYSVLLRRCPPVLSPLAFLALLVLFGLPALAAARLGEIAIGRAVPLVPDAATLGAILFTALFPSIAAYLAWNRAVALVGANLAGPFVHLLPAFAAVQAMLLLGESFRPFHGAGIALVLMGIALATGRLGRRLPP